MGVPVTRLPDPVTVFIPRCSTAHCSSASWPRAARRRMRYSFRLRSSRFTAVHRLSPSTLRAEVRLAERSAGGSHAAAVRLFSETGLLVASLDGVRFAPAGAAAVPDVGPYNSFRWRQLPSPPNAAAAVSAHGAWVVLTDGSETGMRLVTALTAAGGRCLAVRAGGADDPHGIDASTIASLDGDALNACLSDESWRGGLVLRGVVHAWSLDADNGADDDDRTD